MSQFRRWFSGRVSKASGIINKTRLSRSTEDKGLAAHDHIDLNWTASTKRKEHLAGFLDLPRELRDNIYRLTLVLEDPCNIGHLDSIAERRTPSYHPAYMNATRCRLLATCKQVHAEAAPVLYSDNHFEMILPKDSAAWRDFLIVHEEAQKCTNALGIPDRLMALPFHAAYQPLVTNRSFCAGFKERGGGLKFLLSMMRSLAGVEEAYFRLGSLRLGRWRVRSDMYVAGWRRKGYDHLLSAHNGFNCPCSITFDTVATCDDVVLAITRLTIAEPEVLIEAPSAIKHLQYDVRIHACLLGYEQISPPQHACNVSLEELMRRKDVLRITYTFTLRPPHK